MGVVLYGSYVLLVLLVALAVFRVVIGEREVESWGAVRRQRSARLRVVDGVMIGVCVLLGNALLVYLVVGLLPG